MRIAIELTEESRQLLMRHFRERTPLHDILEGAARNEIAGVAVHGFKCDVQQANELLEMARNHCPPAVKDIELAIFAATAEEDPSFKTKGVRKDFHSPSIKLRP